VLSLLVPGQPLRPRSSALDVLTVSALDPLAYAAAASWLTGQCCRNLCVLSPPFLAVFDRAAPPWLAGPAAVAPVVALCTE